MRPLVRPLVLPAVLILFLALLAGTVSAATETAMFKKAEEARAAFEKSEKDQELRHKWINVIELYEALINTYPKGKTAEKSMLALGDLYVGLYMRSRRSADADQAIRYYRRLTKEFPQSPSAAQAQLAIGQIYFHIKNDTDRAYVELLKVELNHPQSRDLVVEARKLMTKISGTPPPAAVAEARQETQGATSAETPTETPAPASPTQVAVVKGVRHWHNPTYSRVAVDLNRPVTFKDNILRSDPSHQRPMRLYIDLENTILGHGITDEMKIADGLLTRARVAQFNPKTVRVVLDIQNISNYRIFSLTDPFRIVIDVMGGPPPPQQTQTAQAKPQEKPSPPSQSSPPSKPEQPKPLADLRDTALKRPKTPRGPASVSDHTSLARQLGLQVSRVVIDPGHGGKDRGATGITGLREKDLTLRVAEMLAVKIKEKLGLEVILTRSKDSFLPLEERTALANTKGADLFISIHANAHPSSKVRGIETYFLNVATDEEAMRVAALENATTKKNMSDLQMILSDLMLNSKITESGHLGVKVQKAMVASIKTQYKGIRDLGVKQAPFYVLIGANMPSILIELGFISNKTEEARLKSSKYLDRLTDGIVNGIKAYNDSIKKGG